MSNEDAAADTQPAADDPFEVRRAKLETVRAAGLEPYRDRYERTHTTEALITAWSGLAPGSGTDDVVSVAGRVVAKRDQGKAIFFVIRDGTGELQLFCRLNVLGEAAFAEVAELDLGDWVGARGTVCRTRRGELSVVPTEVILLSKSLRPLPDKFHGLTDVETRYR